MSDDIDSGLANGLGVLDTMLVINGVVQDRALHAARLKHDCKTVLRAPCPEFDAQIDAALSIKFRAGGTQNCFDAQIDAALKSASGTQRLRIIVSAGVVDKPLAVPTSPVVTVSLSSVTIPTNPVRCKIITDYPRIASMSLENCKRTDYTRAFASRQDALAAGFEDAIITNTDGNIACGTTSNLFIEENGILVTPPLSEGVLAGIVRGKLIAAGAREDIISIERLMKADAVYLTNSITGQRQAVVAV